MIIFTESKALPPEGWRFLGAGQAMVPRKTLQLLVWGVLYEAPDGDQLGLTIANFLNHGGAFKAAKTEVMLNDGGKMDAIYIK